MKKETWTDIVGANSQTYSFTMSEDLNGSQYRCKYELPSNTKCFSESATCYFAEDVKIIKLPENIEEAELYSTVKFTIEATGYNPQYEWSVSYDGKTWEVIANSNTSELSIYVENKNIR